MEQENQVHPVQNDVCLSRIKISVELGWSWLWPWESLNSLEKSLYTQNVSLILCKTMQDQPKWNQKNRIAEEFAPNKFLISLYCYFRVVKCSLVLIKDPSKAWDYVLVWHSSYQKSLPGSTVYSIVAGMGWKSMGFLIPSKFLHPTPVVNSICGGTLLLASNVMARS